LDNCISFNRWIGLIQWIALFKHLSCNRSLKLDQFANGAHFINSNKIKLFNFVISSIVSLKPCFVIKHIPCFRYNNHVVKIYFLKKVRYHYLSFIFCKSFLDIYIIYVQYGISSAILPFYRRLRPFCL